MRPRTYWQAWKTCPEDLDHALRELEEVRVARHADRALGVVMEGRLPTAYRADLADATTNAVTYRELLLALAGITEQVRQHVETYERGYAASAYLPRRVRLKQGSGADAVVFIETWAASGSGSSLMLCGTHFSGRTSVTNEAMYQIGRRFITNPNIVTPIVWSHSGDLAREAYSLGWAIPVRDLGPPQRHLAYDDLIERAEQYLAFLQRYRNGDERR